MDTENFQFLSDRIKYGGFGEKQLDILENHLKEGKEAFQMVYMAEIDKKKFEATLDFRKSDTKDRYFFNGYHASLEKDNGEKVGQYFYLENGNGVKAKEAYNLLDGRSVEREHIRKLTPEETERFKAELKLPAEQRGLAENWEKSPTYIAWIKLNFGAKDKHGNYEIQKFHEAYGFDLQKAVGRFALQELDGGEKEKALFQSLRKGNLQSVTIEKDGIAHKMFMEANPESRTVNIYDGQMKPVLKEELNLYLREGKSQGQDKDLKQDQKQEVKEDAASDTKQKAAKEIKTPKQRPSRSKSVSH